MRIMSGDRYAPLVEVNIGLFACNVGVATTDTLDLGQGVHDFALAVNIGVEQTQDVLDALSNEVPSAQQWYYHT